MDTLDKLESLNGYLKLWLDGGKMPLELSEVIKEADEYIEAEKRINEVGMVQYMFEKNKQRANV